MPTHIERIYVYKRCLALFTDGLSVTDDTMSLVCLRKPNRLVSAALHLLKPALSSSLSDSFPIFSSEKSSFICRRLPMMSAKRDRAASAERCGPDWSWQRLQQDRYVGTYRAVSQRRRRFKSPELGAGESHAGVGRSPPASLLPADRGRAGGGPLLRHRGLLRCARCHPRGHQGGDCPGIPAAGTSVPPGQVQARRAQFRGGYHGVGPQQVPARRDSLRDVKGATG